MMKTILGLSCLFRGTFGVEWDELLTIKRSKYFLQEQSLRKANQFRKIPGGALAKPGLNLTSLRLTDELLNLGLCGRSTGSWVDFFRGWCLFNMTSYVGRAADHFTVGVGNLYIGIIFLVVQV